ncbi:Ubiquinone/menaquinone biosynthesis C-methyltransferase UbiE [Frondihabitans sp. 762G35]|uniref:methyltransferase domain-containing protein n=1 Tax=Frondihabitans sp. 762G35 TaxID=1446794 RepID=UPI000D20394B|nr:methyltransferase domain-containing protein [Frondihabitans sp. 762G35]ARC57579.1 Ubiquinone/menaquinone biosynthesis C-methyltransferase UbiE [Frondihabitans sp. 762G35]
MTVPDLTHRETRALELMDDPDCDLVALERTYRHFALVNGVVAGWRRVYRRRIRPLLEASPDGRLTVLDIGSGAGDVPRALADRARRDGYHLDILAVDPDPRAHAFATAERRSPVPGAAPGRDATLAFDRTTSRALVDEGRRFDLVLSNHVLHHLDPVDLGDLLDDSARLATTLVLHNDIERSRLAYLLYAAATLLPFRGSFIRHDGLLSIRRSYRVDELRREVPAGWKVEGQFPFRLLLTRTGTPETDLEAAAEAAAAQGAGGAAAHPGGTDA